MLKKHKRDDFEIFEKKKEEMGRNWSDVSRGYYLEALIIRDEMIVKNLKN